MKHFSFLFIALFIAGRLFSQGAYTYTPTNFTAKLEVDTAIVKYIDESESNGMSDFDKQFLYVLNYARKRPADFCRQVVVPYLVTYPKLKPIYGESLIVELNRLKGVGMLTIDERLTTIAQAHAADISSHNIMSHQSTDGKTTQQRYERAGLRCGSECINMGNFTSPLEVLISLLIDYNVPNLGHRKSLLNPQMTTVGFGEGSNSKTKLQYTVVDLGCF